MSDTSFHPCMAPVAIKDGTGLLGAETNGAMPASATGLYLESEISMFELNTGEPELCESYFIKVCVTPERSTNQGKNDYLTYGGDFASVERLLSAIVSASVRGIGSRLVEGKYDAYRNQAQCAYDEDCDEGCIEGLNCHVNVVGEGAIEVVFQGDAKQGVVARLGGVFAPEAIIALQNGFEKFRQERDDALRAVHKQIEAAREALVSAAPSI